MGLAEFSLCLNHLPSGLRPLAWVALCLPAMFVLAGQVLSCAFASGQQLGLARLWPDFASIKGRRPQLNGCEVSWGSGLFKGAQGGRAWVGNV